MAKPRVIINMIQTLDGHIAGRDGACHFGSREDRRRMDQLRGQSDAVLITRATLLADNPNLYDRRHPQRWRQPVPVVLLKDTSRKIPDNLRVFQKPHPKGIFIVVGEHPRPEEFHPPWKTLYCSDATDIVHQLRQYGLNRLLLEGGPTLNTMFIGAGMVDEIHLTISPVLLGSSAAQRIIAPHPGVEEQRWILKSCHRRGNEIFLRYLRVRQKVAAES